ncbi:unnamed protein product [Eruca vesicaria subsp. sativa]|uniref:Uncharacterized protein n=1 Tax=Eruca vesicaria subsp. sativa TaxID=29727 RepID=A0ABC8J361_ERUVS|nr:unnamed protein product [Eruca vesicaria subsp. sativa]
MVGVAIDFASTTASPAVANTERERSAGSFPVVLFLPRERRTEELRLATTGARPAGPEWAQQSAFIRMELGGLSLLPDLERYYESSVPDSIAAAIWFTGTTKKSHAYITVIDGLIILDYEDLGRASGFHSH